MDTGSSKLVSYTSNFLSEIPDSSNFCLKLTDDQTYVGYISNDNFTCTNDKEIASIGDAKSDVTMVKSHNLAVDNPYLHNWQLANGSIGLSYNQYCTTNCQNYTSFQAILINSTTTQYNQTFGFDFRNDNSTIDSIRSKPSTFQLGGVKEEFSDSITWLAQPNQPSNENYYHQFFLSDLSFCGENILGNVSNNWPVLIDSGSTCLSLPGEFYDNFASWLNNNTIVNDASELPALSFKMNIDNSSTFYIPLASLVVPSSVIQKEAGAPKILIGGVSKRICVLKGSDIQTLSNGYVYPPPYISFGSLVFESIYFAADFTSGKVGLANKLANNEVNFYQNKTNQYCKAPTSCYGQQSYEPSSNECKSPSCSSYFFAQLDEPTQTCQYSMSSYYFGIIFISIILFMEFISYFVLQYTVSSAIMNRRLITSSFVYVDKFSAWIGQLICLILDLFLINPIRPQEQPPHNLPPHHDLPLHQQQPQQQQQQGAFELLRRV